MRNALTDTIFRLASMIKAVTSVTAMQLELSAPQVLEGFDNVGPPRGCGRPSGR